MVESVMENRGNTGDKFVGQFIDVHKDKISNKFKGEKKTVISYDPETKKPSEPKKTKDIQY